MSLTIEKHAKGCYVIVGYHPIARRNEKGQTLVCPPVCEIYFDDGGGNGVTPEILLELIAMHTGKIPDVQSHDEMVTPQAPKNKGGRPRKATATTVDNSAAA